MLATIDGKQKKKVVGSRAEAELVSHQWATAQQSDLQILPTRLTPTELREAEAATMILRGAGINMLEAVTWLVRNWRQPSAIKWEAAIEAYAQDRVKIGISSAQISNVVKAANRLSAFVKRDAIGPLSSDEIRAFLTFTLKPDAAAATYNGLLCDLRTFLRWAKLHGHIADDPSEKIERRKVRRGLPEVLSPERAEALLRDVESTDPSWIPYLVCCLFGAVRPGTREGESARLDAALRAGKPAFHSGGIEILGKTNSTRIVPWEMCGPLKAWLEAYPPSPGLWGAKTGAQAERWWANFRLRHNLTEDVLRHTAISAMVYRPGASLAQVAVAAGNSEGMIRRHYLGRWTTAESERLWAILPRRGVETAQQAVA